MDHRTRRRRCYRARQGTSCDYCISKGIECSIQHKSAGAAKRGYEPLDHPRGGSGSHISSSVLPDRQLCQELVDLYFRYIDIAFHCLFHRASFEAALHDGSIPKVLLFGVVSLSARFSSHPSLAGIDPRERGRPYAREAERLLDLHNTSLVTIQACMLLGAFYVVEGEAATESVFFSIACRMGTLLDLPNAPVPSRLEQEINLRGASFHPKLG